MKRRDPLPMLRRRARRRALQAVYAWQLSGRPMAEIIEQFDEERDRELADQEYFEDLLRGIDKNLKDIDACLLEVVDRPVEQIDQIERGVLRLAGYELLKRIDVPYRVVIDEAIALVRHFGSDQGHNYINGVLDALAKSARQVEYRS